MPITLYRCGHFPEELNERFERSFRKCDILVVECATKNTEVKKHFNQLSSKGYSDYKFPEYPFSDFVDKLESFIKNSKKQIEIEDSPFSYKEDIKDSKFIEDSTIAFLEGDFEEACTQRKKGAEYLSKSCKKRDIALANQLIKLQKENKGKNILLLIGTYHSVHAELRKRNVEVKQGFSYRTNFFNSFIQLTRRLRFGLPYTQELVARTFPEELVYTYLTKSGLSKDQVKEKTLRFSEKLSYEDVRDLSKYISENSSRGEMPEEATILWLRNKGFEI